jgi:hypothetical protein
MIHFNIGQKIEVNPFVDVKYVKLPEFANNTGIEQLSSFLNKKSCSINTRKIGDKWCILFNVELLDFTTLLKWIAPYRGVFYMNNHSIHFLINEDIMSCW